MREMKVLVACEESQRVCKAFRSKGHEAYSCDIMPCSGGHPEWHIMQNVIPLLNGHCEFETVDVTKHIKDLFTTQILYFNKLKRRGRRLNRPK